MDWRPSQTEYWHTQYEGTFLKCPECLAVLTIQQALDDGCADCGAVFDIAYAPDSRF